MELQTTKSIEDLGSRIVKCVQEVVMSEILGGDHELPHPSVLVHRYNCWLRSFIDILHHRPIAYVNSPAFVMLFEKIFEWGFSFDRLRMGRKVLRLVLCFFRDALPLFRQLKGKQGTLDFFLKVNLDHICQHFRNLSTHQWSLLRSPDGDHMSFDGYFYPTPNSSLAPPSA